MMLKLRNLALFSGVLAAGLFGCTKDNPLECSNNFCSDLALPYCDLTGEIGGEPNTCIAVDCTPGEFAACRGDQAITCNPMGMNYDLGLCDLGCDPASGCITEVISCEPNTLRCGDRVVERCDANGEFSSEACDVACIDEGGPHCAYLEPKYLPDICDVPGTGHLDFGPFDTNIDSQCNGGIVAQVDGPEICVVRYSTITVPAGVDAKVTGSRALALVADEKLEVLGTLDVSADASRSGPGAGEQNRGRANGFGGGGGGGFKGTGGSGGNNTSPGGAANGGPARQAAAFPSLVAGQGEISSDSPISAGGGAGGAAILVSCRGFVEISGLVDAGGGGGRGGGDGDGRPNNVAINAGGGGGSGGQVVIQALSVRVTGTLVANGGAGGNGSGRRVNPLSGRDSGPDNYVAAPGEDGRRDGQSASAPPSTDPRGGSGSIGFGGYPGAAGPADGSFVGAGGGGSGGFFRIVSRATDVIATPLVASPTFEAVELASFR